MFSTGFPKSRNDGGGRGTALKPAWEPITLSQKPREGTCEANDAKWGCGYLNIDDARVPIPEGDSVKEFARNPERNAARPLQHGVDWTCRASGERADTGRRPANVVHDAALAGFPNGAARFFHRAKPSRSERDAAGWCLIPSRVRARRRSADLFGRRH